MTVLARLSPSPAAWIAGMIVAVVVAVVAFWQLGGDDQPVTPDPPTVTGAPLLTASGGEPFAWTVTVSPGQGGRLCGHAVFGLAAEDRTGQPCSVVVRPGAVGNELFGSGGSTSNAGRTLLWGLVDPAGIEVMVELDDGRTQTATVAVGGDRNAPDGVMALWAFATDGDVTARIARAEDGTEERIESAPLPEED